MNEKVIEEIANQLGLAVDQASQLVAQVIPQYAAMKVMERSIEAAGLVLLVIVSAVVAIIAVRGITSALPRWFRRSTETRKRSGSASH